MVQTHGDTHFYLAIILLKWEHIEITFESDPIVFLNHALYQTGNQQFSSAWLPHVFKHTLI